MLALKHEEEEKGLQIPDSHSMQAKMTSVWCSQTLNPA